ncbi:glycogen debranching protein GlgX [Planktothrix sp. FACHB-1365]|uniref:glycogen debranching protein GlgX n=1 Tax=Planktothrix sp. FACHB-1365 TaxID=2692855 RepID=UPI0016840325|nr:glycogen debranching protein GlgX [Planktothrix sp. FACHB-1365]MBD2481737.1 glycogen debranching protein GlgX [Planktothrix sp. FACHB-1365]
MNFDVLSGQSFPLGATVYPKGVNFCVFSKNCLAIELLLFDSPDAAVPTHIIPFDPKRNKTFYYWHIFVTGVKPGQIYGYRVYGLFEPELGYRFDPDKLLLDPYAKAIVNTENYSRVAASVPGNNFAQALKGVVVDNSTYDWEGDKPLELPYSQTIIYELHVGGFTRNPNSGISPEKRGTYAGLIEKIPYLKDLGITAVELLPIHQFDEQDAVPPRNNYWGYSTISFFAPHRQYSSCRDAFGPLDEFRDMVKALHKAGIEVILDVVYNHTAEGNEDGPTLSFRGLDNSMYYILEKENPAYYSNYSGCGNTIKANHEISGQLIIDSLRYWVSEMHVDGFRFDLASILSRDKEGNPIDDAPILWIIKSDPVLAGAKLIVEAWDAGGLYQVGSLAGDRFGEWNGQFRDDVRRFVKGDEEQVEKLAYRIMGSPDIYPHPDREVHCSVNFVTCHDGFTLNDLVCYNEKHNEANGEKNRDGSDCNFSWNCGIEGPTDDLYIQALRLQQIKNLWVILLLSQGTPMLLMGDEVCRTQFGNNNAYCQDNELGWFDWSDVGKHPDVLRFVKSLIRFKKELHLFQLDDVLEVDIESDLPYIMWHGVRLGKPDLNENSRSIACSLYHPEKGEYLHIMLNAYWEPLKFQIPPLSKNERWHRLVDTALVVPNDISSLSVAPPISVKYYHVSPRSAVVLMAQSLR